MKDKIENTIAWGLVSLVCFGPIALAVLASDYLISLL